MKDYLIPISAALSLMVVAVLVGLLVEHLVVPAQAQSIPALLNGNFEDEFVSGGAPELQVGKYWEPWYQDGDGWHRPEFLPYQEVVYDGQYAQKTFTVYARHDGGLMQPVEGLEEDAWYKFSCRVYTRSAIGGKSFSLVGVNPWGNAWPRHWSTVWGKASYNDFGEWVEVEVLFQAWSDRAMLFTKGEGEYPVNYQDWYWDGCSFSQTTPSTPPVPPTPVPDTCPSLEEIGELIDNRAPVKWPR